MSSSFFSQLFVNFPIFWSTNEDLLFRCADLRFTDQSPSSDFGMKSSSPKKESR